VPRYFSKQFLAHYLGVIRFTLSEVYSLE